MERLENEALIFQNKTKKAQLQALQDNYHGIILPHPSSPAVTQRNYYFEVRIKGVNPKLFRQNLPPDIALVFDIKITPEALVLVIMSELDYSDAEMLQRHYFDSESPPNIEFLQCFLLIELPQAAASKLLRKLITVTNTQFVTPFSELDILSFKPQKIPVNFTEEESDEIDSYNNLGKLRTYIRYKYPCAKKNFFDAFAALGEEDKKIVSASDLAIEAMSMIERFDEILKEASWTSKGIAEIKDKLR